VAPLQQGVALERALAPRSTRFNDRRTAPPRLGGTLRIGFVPADVISITV
jgi:hypothetical protein